jgi:uncharacterized protein (TIGR02421 family)
MMAGRVPRDDDKNDGDLSALAAVRAGLSEHHPVRAALTHGGRINIERPLPHLLFHQRSQHCDTSADRLVTPLPPYVIAEHGHDQHALGVLVTRLVELLSERCGSVLVLELVEKRAMPTPTTQSATPAFAVTVEDATKLDGMVSELVTRLERVEILGHARAVRVQQVARDELSIVAQHVLSSPTIGERCVWLQLDVFPIYRDVSLQRCFPRVLAELQAALYDVLLDTLYRHAVNDSKLKPATSQALARTTLERAARDVATTLVDVAGRLGFLLNLSPSNLPTAWQRFRATKYSEVPRFEYRPLMLDPLELKRSLFAAPFDDVEDPVIAYLLRAVVEEYDGLLGMLAVRGGEDFSIRSVRVFGAPGDDTVELAERILSLYDVSRPTRPAEVDALELARRARARLDRYQRVHADFPNEVALRNDVAAGMMVYCGAVLIHEDLQVCNVRAEALLAHEIDTHVLTYHNGLLQPLPVLATGLAGYESTQEGLAVLAEYLVGGLTPHRFRVLAARVLAVRAMLQGASFVDVFRLLHDDHGILPRSAFDIAVRVFRGGGLTKDALYLSGLCDVIAYLCEHGDLTPLFAGKIPAGQWDRLQALRLRGLVIEPAAKPLWLGRRDVEHRLSGLRGGLSIFDMASHEDSPPDSKREAS